MHFRRVTGGIRVSVIQPSTPASMEYRVAIWSFSIFNTKNAQKYQSFYPATQMEHDQSSYFSRGPDDFCWGPAPMGPTLVTGAGRICGMTYTCTWTCRPNTQVLGGYLSPMQCTRVVAGTGLYDIGQSVSVLLVHVCTRAIAGRRLH